MPHSYLCFRVLDHSTFRKDNILGQATFGLQRILRDNSGKLENLELTLDLNSEKYGLFIPVSSGKLIVILDGLNINLQSELSTHPSLPSEYLGFKNKL